MCVLVTHRTGALDEGGGRQPELSGLAWGRSHRETPSLPQVLGRALGRGKLPSLQKILALPFPGSVILAKSHRISVPHLFLSSKMRETNNFLRR